MLLYFNKYKICECPLVVRGSVFKHRHAESFRFELHSEHGTACMCASNTVQDKENKTFFSPLLGHLKSNNKWQRTTNCGVNYWITEDNRNGEFGQHYVHI